MAAENSSLLSQRAEAAHAVKVRTDAAAAAAATAAAAADLNEDKKFPRKMKKRKKTLF